MITQGLALPRTPKTQSNQSVRSYVQAPNKQLLAPAFLNPCTRSLVTQPTPDGSTRKSSRQLAPVASSSLLPLPSPAQHRSAPIARPPLQPTGPLHPIPTTATTHPPAAPHSARRELVGKPARYWLRVTWVPGDRAPKSRIPPRPASPLPACEKRISTGVETSQEANRREVRLGFSTFLRCGRWRCHPRYSFVIPPPRFPSHSSFHLAFPPSPLLLFNFWNGRFRAMTTRRGDSAENRRTHSWPPERSPSPHPNSPYCGL